MFTTSQFVTRSVFEHKIEMHFLKLDMNNVGDISCQISFLRQILIMHK